MEMPRKTVAATAEGGGLHLGNFQARFEVVPVPTEAPRVKPRDLAKRQDSEEEEAKSCGVYSLTGLDEWAPWACGSDCRTIGNHFGCLATVYTACYPQSDDFCSTGRVGNRDLCCYADSHPHCMTGLKQDDGSDITAYICANENASGEYSIHESTPEVTTEVTTTRTTNTDIAGDPNETGPATTSTGAGGDGGEGSGGSSGPPVGAIVGGVLGGIAAIGLIGLAIWWFMGKRKRGGNGSNAAYAPAASGDAHAATSPYNAYDPNQSRNYDYAKYQSPSTYNDQYGHHPPNSHSPSYTNHSTPASHLPPQEPVPLQELPVRPMDSPVEMPANSPRQAY